MVLDDLMRSYDFDSPDIAKMLITSAVAFGFGYWVYVYCIIFQVKQKKSPYPHWMHTFYLACDTSGAVFWFLLAKDHDWFWFFTCSSIAMAVWVVCELWSITTSIKYERQEIYGEYYDEPVTVRQAVTRTVVETALFLCVVNLTVQFFGGLDDAGFFKLYVWTNLLVAIGPSYYWAKQRNLEGKSLGLAVMILASIVATYLPPGWGMWATASDYFDQPWFYLAGFFTTGLAIYNVWLVASLRRAENEREVEPAAV